VPKIAMRKLRTPAMGKVTILMSSFNRQRTRVAIISGSAILARPSVKDATIDNVLARLAGR
jgi:hypothetical protein